MRFLTEKMLWSQVREGDESAFEELFNLYADSLLAYGMKFTPDREQVKDIIQDLFVRIIKRHDSLPEVENVKAYLLQAVLLRRERHPAEAGGREHHGGHG